MAESRRKNLKQYVIYLNRTLDKALIEHLEPLLTEHRANEEIRRLLHTALRTAQQPTLLRNPVHRVEEPTSVEISISAPAALSAKEKARRVFGTFDDE